MAVFRIICSVQEGALDSKTIKQLQATITSTYKAHFGSDFRPIFFWLRIPAGQAYIAGKPSTTSTIQIPVDDNMPDNKRHPFMHEVCVKWQHITGCSKNEIIVNSSDMSQFTQFHQAMEQRFSPEKRKKAKFSMLVRFLFGYLKNGYLNTSVNF